MADDWPRAGASSGDPAPAVDEPGAGVETVLLDRVRSALDHAARAGANPRLAAQLDREAVLALRATARIDPVLEQLELDRLTQLVDRCAGRTGGQDAAAPDLADRTLSWDVLDLIRRSSVLQRIPPAETGGWADRILQVVEASQLTVGPLFRQRADLYGTRPLFVVPRADGERVLTWRQVASRVEFLARGLLSLDSSATPAPVALLSENRIELALLDLACLTSGLLDVVLPANATEADVGYMLRHSHAGTVVVSNRRQLRKVLQHREQLPELRRVVVLDAEDAVGEDVLTLDDLAARATHIPASVGVRRSEAVRVDDPATIMYTSGTTGTPKGIRFSHRNLVVKRFARALALPGVGEQDVFLCFLPLFHTFGRFFEMLGCIFWGATYCFLENPSAEALIAGMRRYRPTVFISVPKKWLELYEAIAQRADPLEASDAELLEATHAVTGGRLRLGLSAAGYLDSDVFRFFQRQGVELVSGFGMTEATGGITMTPPGDYRDDSLGVALPGIELRLADDGELLIRGPYVMMGYFEPPGGEGSFDDEGWLPTGDLMEVDRDGHLRLVDRKKEIYKNIKGETIAPQRVESHFRDFESVGRAFLVGDHREYNTLLIYPNPGYRDLDFASLSAQEVREHFRSLVVSVNKFLAPYERIVDFAIIERDLDPERGELTPKGTARRSVVVRNFADVIRTLYRRANLSVGGAELTLPNWLFQALGLTAQDVRVHGNRIQLKGSDRSLTVEQLSEGLIRIGSARYSHPSGRPLNLGSLISTPRLWLGNAELVDFLPLGLEERQRPGRSGSRVEWCGPVEPYRSDPRERAALERALEQPAGTLDELDLAGRLLGDAELRSALDAVELIERLLETRNPSVLGAARLILGRVATRVPLEVQRSAFRVLATGDSDARFRETLERFLFAEPELLDSSLRQDLARSDPSPAKVEAWIELAESLCGTGEAHSAREGLAANVLELLAGYGAEHPLRYIRLRALLTRMSLEARTEELRHGAEEALRQLIEGFRDWLGPTPRIAVDPESRREYRWDEVVVFEDCVPRDDRRRLLSAIGETALLREACFLFSSGAQIELGDMPPGSATVRLLGSRHGKSVYRITVQTRFQGTYELAVNVNHNLSRQQVEEEILWLTISGDPGRRDRLVEEFGGYWPEQDLWTEEFVSGETLDQAMTRLVGDPARSERLGQAWSFLSWSTLSAYADFWNRAGRRWEIADPSLSNVVVPTEDYRIGARIVSLSARRPHRGVGAMLRSFREEFVEPAEFKYPAITGKVGWELICSSLLEAVGEAEGLRLLEGVPPEDVPSELVSELGRFVTRVRSEGFAPMRLHFATERYRRWESAGGGATTRARARTLQELYDTYGLQRLAVAYPEVRVRFFRETALRDVAAPLGEGLDLLIAGIRCGDLHAEELVDAITELRGRLELGGDEDYFLARMSFPHLKPEDDAGFVSMSLGGRHRSEIVVTFDDAEGRPFRVRHALSPKEVERLHRLFLTARLEVHFRAEHQYLVAMTERGQIVAGIYYEVDEAEHSAHLEKIVVADRFRGRGVAEALMGEFFNRLRAAGLQTVTTGYFRPEYFQRHGFRVEKRYAGLVREL